MRHNAKGFSFIEVLLVVAIIGIISAIAIPMLVGQKKNAELVGDAQQNSKALQMMLETRKADLGSYGTAGTTYTWKADGTLPSSNLAPLFAPKGSSKMNYALLVTSGGLSYTLTVNDPRPGKGNAQIYKTDQTGQSLP